MHVCIYKCMCVMLVYVPMGCVVWGGVRAGVCVCVLTVALTHSAV